MFKLHDRIKETSYTQGAGSLALRGATEGFAAFSSVYSDQDTFFYCTTNNSQYEVGLGRYVSADDSIERVEIFESTTGSAISWGQGLKEIYVTYPADRAIFSNGSMSGNMIPVMKDGNEIDGSSDLLYSSGELSVPSLASNIVETNQLTVDTIEFVSTNANLLQHEPFARNTLKQETGIDDVIYTSGEVDEIFGLNKQGAGLVFAGPLNNCSGGPCPEDYPEFRPLTSDDIPVISAENVSYSPSEPGNWDTQPTNARQAFDIMALYDDKFLNRDNNLSDLTNPVIARVNLGVSASGQAVWGQIGGTIENQTDLLNILNSHSHDISEISGNLPTTQLGSGLNASSGTFWRGDGLWSSLEFGDLYSSNNLSDIEDISIAKINLDVKNIGLGNQAHGGGFVYGNDCFASGTQSFAIGQFSQANSPNSFAIGRQCEVNHFFSVSIGQSVISDGRSSYGFGKQNRMFDTDPGNELDITAVGISNNLSGVQSYVSGYNNDLSASYSVAVGVNNTIVGQSVACFGRNNLINGASTNTGSFVFGESCELIQGRSVGVIGHEVHAGQIVSDNDKILEIGVGNSSSRTTTRYGEGGSICNSIKEQSSRHSDGGSVLGSERSFELPREMYAFRRNGDDIYIDVNIAGTVKTLQLGTVT